MVRQLERTLPEGLSSELLDRVLEESEQALIDATHTEFGGGLLGVQLAWKEPEVQMLRDALAEIERAHAGASAHLASLCDRVREAGVGAAALELETQPHLLQVIRITLELFFRMHTDAADYERTLREQGEATDVAVLAGELFEGHRRLLVSLRTTLN